MLHAKFLCHFSKTGLGLGVGGMERLTAYGEPLWLILAGVRLLVASSADPVDHERPVLVRR